MPTIRLVRFWLDYVGCFQFIHEAIFSTQPKASSVNNEYSLRPFKVSRRQWCPTLVMEEIEDVGDDFSMPYRLVLFWTCKSSSFQYISESASFPSAKVTSLLKSPRKTPEKQSLQPKMSLTESYLTDTRCILRFPCALFL